MNARYAHYSKVIFWAVICAAFVVRIINFPLFVHGDLRIFGNYVVLMQSTPWEQLFAKDFTKLSSAFLYLWLPISLLPVEPVYAIKAITMCFDALCAFWCFAIVRLRFPVPSIMPHIIGLLLLWSPMLMIISSRWGQIDSVYTAFLLQSIYYCVRAHSERACKNDMLWALGAFSMALSFKLQSTFFLGVVAFWIGKRMIPWWSILVPVLFYVAMQAPRLALGFPLEQVFSGYERQIQTFYALSVKAPNIYYWIQQFPVDINLVTYIGVGAGGIFCGVLWWLGRKIQGPVSQELMLLICIASLVCLPSILPRIHERYFLPAVLAVILLFSYKHRPALWIAACLVNFSCINAFMNYHVNLLEYQYLRPDIAPIFVILGVFLILNEVRRMGFPPVRREDPSAAAIGKNDRFSIRRR